MRITITFAAAGAGLSALLLGAYAMQPLKIDFSNEAVGAEGVISST